MVKGLLPPYLSSLLPLPVNRVSSYNLRNSNDIQTIPARTNLYYTSFLPSAIREWNSLPLDIRNSDSLYSFNRNLNNRDRFVPKYYYSGNRKLQILHTRLRTGRSSLNQDLFYLSRSLQIRLYLDVEKLKTLNTLFCPDVYTKISVLTLITQSQKGGGGPYVPTHQFLSSFAWLIPSMYQL